MKTIILFLAICLAVVSIGATSQSQPKTWEYKLQMGVKEKEINALAAEGWELVATGNYGSSSGYPYLIFKRAK